MTHSTGSSSLKKSFSSALSRGGVHTPRRSPCAHQEQHPRGTSPAGRCGHLKCPEIQTKNLWGSTTPQNHPASKFPETLTRGQCSPELCHENGKGERRHVPALPGQ
eukprot:CAMPEP_0174284222 /NCGR_PEP_ID=MMETSP0809-20121228/4968_1 /TAXON_ID=73025 ORGANISM="Eutreptiella gymnastica-like, Strain CCMP1594" /NCGR_SAMPLE_ID=MMETSP0809 /ASSEMBLY_ACC=CAM_ASM_000658 /LENGTH=105 /DNA_ID=CAMNT_0015379605 /DNA_START=548 /DNA_END=865 /DNA_ORIENTATION=-